MSEIQYNAIDSCRPDVVLTYYGFSSSKGWCNRARAIGER